MSAPRPVVSPSAFGQALPAVQPHYDPGPGYVEKVPVNERPLGAPRCFGDYNPVVHQCRTCPVVTPCQPDGVSNGSHTA